MTKYFCVSVTFLDGRFHGRYGDGEPEWPPSPLRLFQAIVAANAAEIESGGDIVASLRWLARQTPPSIVAPRSEVGTGYMLSVPNNAMDIVGRAWSKGNYFGTGDSNPATHRTMKRVRPVQMFENDVVHYVWPLSDSDAGTNDGATDALAESAKKMFTLGWGVDMVVANAQVLGADQIGRLQGEWWKPNVATGQCVLRVPRERTLDVLRDRHAAFLNRITPSGFVPVDPLTEFSRASYRRPNESLGRHHVVFELRNDDDSFFVYPQRKLIHIAGMVRHLAIETMKHSPPSSVEDVGQWVDRYVAGHARDNAAEHRRFSYLPLPSIGRHADHAVRRVMISAPCGDDRLLDHLATRLAGMRLKPTKRTSLENPPTLIRVYRDKVAAFYTRAANTWASVTPVVLPGHNDRKPAKTVKLVEKALRQSGIDQPCSFEWRAVSWWPKSLTAFKYDRDGKPTGYIRPDHLETLSLVHLKLRFDDDMLVPGPIAVGSGRHCGLGIVAGLHIQ